MFTETENQFVDIEAFSVDGRQPLSLRPSFSQTVGHVLKLAARRLGMGDAVSESKEFADRRAFAAGL